jgi:hypothetical protein
MHPIRTLTGVGLIVLVTILGASAPASAGPIVDPSTLTPVPPPGAVCRADGDWTICHTVFLEDIANEPMFDVPCGTVYETSHDPRTGLRWYLDGLLVRRHVYSYLDGTWTLSPTGEGPTLSFIGRANWSDVYAVPGDEDSAATTFRALGLHVFVPGGVIHIAGIERPDAEPRGVYRFPEDPQAADALCAALTA